jgi:RHS repeat-associated protein
MADFTIVQMYDQYDRVTEGKNRITYGCHVDGQLATVTKGKKTEGFIWDGLALVKRGAVSYLNEPHPGGGAPVVSSDGGVMFNDILGTTLGVDGADGYSPIAKTAFGDTVTTANTTFFTGKPQVDGLGHAFLMRNYRADLGKWPTADPLGYPDGWNQMAYCRNGGVGRLDFIGGATIDSFYDALNHYAYGVGEEAHIGSLIVSEAMESNEYKTEVIDRISSTLAGMSYYLDSGYFSCSGSFSWEQGFILGRNTMNWSINGEWLAGEWNTPVGANYKYRTIIGMGYMVLSTRDRWDFDVHEGDSILRSVFGEIIPNEIASLYSIIVASNIGEAYDLEGGFMFKERIYATQIIYLPSIEEE